jgi:hypothetical protein
MITEQEARAKGDEKVKKIKLLAKELQIQIMAKQVITPQNTIETLVFFVDTEKYDLAPNKVITRNLSKNPNDKGPLSFQ